MPKTESNLKTANLKRWFCFTEYTPDFSFLRQNFFTKDSKESVAAQKKVGRALREIERIIELAKEDPDMSLEELKSLYVIDIEALRILRFFSGSFLHVFNVNRYNKGNLNLVSYMVNILRTINEDFFSNVSLSDRVDDRVMTLGEEELQSQPVESHADPIVEQNEEEERPEETPDQDEEPQTNAENEATATLDNLDEPQTDDRPNAVGAASCLQMEVDKPEKEKKKKVAQSNHDQEIAESEDLQMNGDISNSHIISEVKVDLRVEKEEIVQMGHQESQITDGKDSYPTASEAKTKKIPREQSLEKGAKEKSKHSNKKTKHNRESIENEHKQSKTSAQNNGDKDRVEAQPVKEKESKNKDKSRHQENDENSRPRKNSMSPEAKRHSKTPERLEKLSKRKSDGQKEADKYPKDERKDQRKSKQDDYQNDRTGDDRQAKRDHDLAKHYDDRHGRNDYKTNGGSGKPFKRDDDYKESRDKDRHHANSKPFKYKDEYEHEPFARNNEHSRGDRYGDASHYKGNGNRYYEESRYPKYARDERYSDHSPSENRSRNRRGNSNLDNDKGDAKDYPNDYHRNAEKTYERGGRVRGGRGYPRDRHEDRR